MSVKGLAIHKFLLNQRYMNITFLGDISVLYKYHMYYISIAVMIHVVHMLYNKYFKIYTY